jgi:uncharacterized protein YndB with AHSA1/START domain
VQIDVPAIIGATSRKVEGREVDGQPARAVIATRGYATTVEDLWDALTNPTRIPRWFMPISGELKLGGRYQLEGNAGGTITTCEPRRRLAVTWEFGGGMSWVRVSLEPDGDGARLTLEHLAPLDPAFWDEFGPGAVGVGWDGALLGLLRHIAGEALADRAAALAWQTSDKGKAFNRAASEAWRGASVVFGTPADAAAAAAMRTSAFYTGEPAD